MCLAAEPVPNKDQVLSVKRKILKLTYYANQYQEPTKNPMLGFKTCVIFKKCVSVEYNNLKTTTSWNDFVLYADEWGRTTGRQSLSADNTNVWVHYVTEDEEIRGSLCVYLKY